MRAARPLQTMQQNQQRVLRAVVLPVAMREHTRIVVHLEQPLFGRWQPRKAPSPSPAVNGHPVAAAARPPGHVVGHLLDRRGPLRLAHSAPLALRSSLRSVRWSRLLPKTIDADRAGLKCQRQPHVLFGHHIVQFVFGRELARAPPRVERTPPAHEAGRGS